MVCLNQTNLNGKLRKKLGDKRGAKQKYGGHGPPRPPLRITTVDLKGPFARSATSSFQKFSKFWNSLKHAPSIQYTLLHNHKSGWSVSLQSGGQYWRASCHPTQKLCNIYLTLYRKIHFRAATASNQGYAHLGWHWKGWYSVANLRGALLGHASTDFWLTPVCRPSCVLNFTFFWLTNFSQ